MKVKFKKREHTTKVIVAYAQDDKGARQLNMEARANGSLHHGYHYVVREDGTVEEGRAPDEVSSFKDKTAIYVRDNMESKGFFFALSTWPDLEVLEQKEEDIV